MEKSWTLLCIAVRTTWIKTCLGTSGVLERPASGRTTYFIFPSKDPDDKVMSRTATRAR